MRDITHCPNCQTQFFVSEAQLNQHGGLVRCGQCLHVFNAKEQFVSQTLSDNTASKIDLLAPDNASFATTSVSEPPNTQPSSSWPTLDQHFNTETSDTDNPQSDQAIQETQSPPTVEQDKNIEVIESPALQDEVPNINALHQEDYIQADSTHQQSAATHSATDDPTGDAQLATPSLNDISKLSFIAGNQTNYFNDLAKHAKLDGKKSSDSRHPWAWALGAFILLLIATAQSVYFLRNTIAIYYPNLKPHLLQACQYLDCHIELPKHIEWIIIDDSDMQEDLEHAGIMHLTSSLYNKAGFVQAYPNVELTLTDTNDSAVLRRIFKPAEYLPPKTDITAGFSAGSEIKVKLSITTEGVSVAGYRLYVTY
jgi:predicted Zn finger-like uncharacterized protein